MFKKKKQTTILDDELRIITTALIRYKGELDNAMKEISTDKTMKNWHISFTTLKKELHSTESTLKKLSNLK
ncbi:hypothetical protein [Anaerosalibacter massiliensis]|uniref:hypothetical protein n=1 Tax=Anaerosalibacter massiliensis TaxID=1347392 RepID=UPI0005B2DAFA|nr:hypothetical protein [Anaerosalibacter massiliensis]